MKIKEWVRIGFQPVGGLREVGFIGKSDYLLILGTGGRTVFDCSSAVKYARDRFDYYNESWDSNTGIIEGFDEFRGQQIICGGFEYKDVIQKSTSDNWATEIRVEERYDYRKELKRAEVLYLKHQDLREIEVEKFHYGITRSFGFSPTGNSFIITESDGVTFWKKVSSRLEDEKSQAISLLKAKSGTKVAICDQIAQYALPLDAYQTSNTNFMIENLIFEDKTEGSMVRLRGDQGQLEFRANLIRQVNIFDDILQLDLLLMDSVWRSITIK